MSEVAASAPEEKATKVYKPRKILEKEKNFAKMTATVKKFLGRHLKRNIEIPGDLASGVVFGALIQRISPGALPTYNKKPENALQKADNFKKIFDTLIKFGVWPSELPQPETAADGKANKKLISLLYRLATRSTKLRLLPHKMLKMIKHKQDVQKEKVEKAKKLKAERIKQRTLGCIRAARYQRQYKREREKRIRMHMKAEKKHNFYVPPEPRLAWVMRLRGLNGVGPKVRKILQLFRLRQIQNACFVRLNKATLNMLKVIEPYVAFGYPTVRSVRALLLKRGYAKIGHRRVAITSNELISKHLGKIGVYTLDDLVHEIVTVGKRFAKCNRFLWPFKMNSPRGGYGKSKLRHFVEGGSAGNRMGRINRLIRQCL